MPAAQSESRTASKKQIEYISVSFRIPTTLLEEIAALAAADDRSKTKIFIRALGVYMELRANGADY